MKCPPNLRNSTGGIQSLEAIVDSIIKVLSALLKGDLGLRLMSDKGRISNSEFAVLSVLAFVGFAFFGWWFVNAYLSFRLALGLPPVPQFLLAIYTPEEISVLPLLDGAALYSYVVLWLKLKNYPEWLDQQAVSKWRLKRLYGYLGFWLLASVALVTYLVVDGRFS